MFVVTWSDIKANCSMGSMVSKFPTDVPQPDYAMPWDINGDGIVDLADATILANNWLKQVTPMTDGDMNGDGIVNQKDLVLLQAHWQERK